MSAASGRAAVGHRPPQPLVVKGLTKRYARTTALDAIDLGVAAGAIVGLVGPNGSGKTTALHVVAGLVRPDAGHVLVSGLPAGSLPARRAVAFVPDHPSGLDELTVGELVALVAALHRAGAAAARRATVLRDALGLERHWRSRLGTLSLGWRRRASLVAALALEASLVLVDEATAALDPEAVVVLREALSASAARGAGILLATQDLHFAGSVCDEVVLLAAGRVAATGAPDALAAGRGADGLESFLLVAGGHAGLPERVRRELDAL